LAENSGQNPEQLLWQLLESKSVWNGYNLRVANPELEDLLKAGIIDPASVTKETVQNAASVVSKLITVKVGVMLADREQKHD
jgi:chaperonin GroEL